VNSTSASAPPIDQTTAAAIREALGAARMGRLGEACSTAERALANGGDAAALNAMLGMFRTRAGEHQAAVRHLELAHAARPNDTRIAANLASALTSIGDLERAFAVASRERAFADPTLQLCRIRAFVADQLCQFDEAIDAYEHVVAQVPGDWETWNNLGNVRVLSGDPARGVADLEKAVSLAPDSAPALLNLARAYRDCGDFARAEQVLRKMADDFPEDPKPLIDLHDLLKVQMREDDVLEIIDRALKLLPDDLSLLLARARHFGSILEMERGEEAFRKVLEHDPSNAEAFIGLATLYEHFRAAALQDLSEEAEGLQIELNSRNLVQAFAHRRAKRFNEGVAALGKIAPDFETARREHLFGQMLEGLEDHDAAFAAFEKMNETHAADPSRPVERAEALRAELKAQIGAITQVWFDGWAAPPLEPEQPAPAFLVGFPRSGTTLLDTMLMGHPDAVVMEERPVINRLKGEIGGFEAIAGMDEGKVRQAQRRYFEIAAEYADLRAGALLIDKSPLLLNEAALIHRLFPGAKFILALRHPVDVLLSCFVSNFRLNNAMSNFVRLGTSAEFYDLTFRAWESACSLLPLDVHRIVYEEMVEDPAGALRPLVEWLGLAWSEEVLDHRKTAAGRGVITTASYAQVTEPIYRRSIGRWRHYRKQLEPILPVLKPWVEKFGYSL
jgi:tetratricopeptide (TPR) repeat protein